MTPEEYKQKRADIVFCGADKNIPDGQVIIARALLLIADQLNALVEQNRGAGVFRACLLAALKERK